MKTIICAIVLLALPAGANPLERDIPDIHAGASIAGATAANTSCSAVGIVPRRPVVIYVPPPREAQEYLQWTTPAYVDMFGMQRAPWERD